MQPNRISFVVLACLLAVAHCQDQCSTVIDGVQFPNIAMLRNTQSDYSATDAANSNYQFNFCGPSLEFPYCAGVANSEMCQNPTGSPKSCGTSTGATSSAMVSSSLNSVTFLWTGGSPSVNCVNSYPAGNGLYQRVTNVTVVCAPGEPTSIVGLVTELPPTPPSTSPTCIFEIKARSQYACPQSGVNPPPASSPAEYCLKVGGNVTLRQATYNTNSAPSQWLALSSVAEFCTFTSAPDSTGFSSQIAILTETLYAAGPTLAVVAYMEPVSMPDSGGANPSTIYCQKLGGTAVWGGQNNLAGGGWSAVKPGDNVIAVLDVCVFPDGSAIDTWGLAYKAMGVVRGVDLTTVVRYQPGPQGPPKIFFG